jgi:hypothetical protein
MQAGNQIQIDRGGTSGSLGLSTVSAGLATIVLFNAFDPAVVSTLEPEMRIQVYSTQFGTETAGAIFAGSIVDVNSTYVMNDRLFGIDTYVTITAVDAVQSHANVFIPGVTTTAGYERWEERIAGLAPYALKVVDVPDVNTNTVIDSF